MIDDWTGLRYYQEVMPLTIPIDQLEPLSGPFCTTGPDHVWGDEIPLTRQNSTELFTIPRFEQECQVCFRTKVIGHDREKVFLDGYFWRDVLNIRPSLSDTIAVAVTESRTLTIFEGHPVPTDTLRIQTGEAVRRITESWQDTAEPIAVALSEQTASLAQTWADSNNGEMLSVRLVEGTPTITPI